MRICLPIHSFEPGGVERVALRLAERWQAGGHTVTIVLGRDRGAARDQLRAAAPGLSYAVRAEPFSTAAWETPWLIWCLWLHLRALPKNAMPDVIFCPGNTYTIVCVAMKLLLRRQCPPVLVKISNDLVRSDFPRPAQQAYRLWLRIQGRLLDRFVALAEPMLPQLRAELAIPDGKALVIPDPALAEAQLDAPFRPAPVLPANDRVFLAVARLNRQKNLPLLVEAFAAIRREEDRLIIAGTGPDQARIARRIVALGLQGSVVLPGHVAEVRVLIDGAHVVVLSSDYEGVPAAVIEALAAGRPVAATDCCSSMRWLLQDGAFGALAELGDARALGEAMEQAAAMTPPHEAMQAFAALFTLSRAAPAYIDAMQSLAERDGARTQRHFPERAAP